MINVMMNASKLRCRILAWMREPEWKWYIVHTDWMDDLLPKTAPQFITSPSHAPTSLGFDTFTNNPNGPNDTTEVQNETI